MVHSSVVAPLTLPENPTSSFRRVDLHSSYSEGFTRHEHENIEAGGHSRVEPQTDKVQKMPSLCRRQQDPFLSRGIRHDVLWLKRRRSPDFPEEKAAAALHEQGGTHTALQGRGRGVYQRPASPGQVEGGSRCWSRRLQDGGSRRIRTGSGAISCGDPGRSRGRARIWTRT